jgi:RNA polymerase sigma-70 factor (ECF subfamily)
MSTANLPSQEAIHTLYSNHHSWLKGWLRRRVDCCEQAADLSHDTFVRVLRAGIAAQIEEPRSYLAKVAGGLVVDFFRRRAIEQAYLGVLAGLPQAEVPSLETQAIVVESLVRIEAMLEGLKPKVREAFLLAQLEGLTYPQIAERLDISLRTVSNYMTLAFDHCFELAP